MDGAGSAVLLCQIEPVSDRYLPKLLGPVLRRGHGELQVGVDPGRAVVLRGLSEPQVSALVELDGTRPLPAALATDAGRDLLALLTIEGLLVDAGTPRPLPPGTGALLEADAEALLRLTSPDGTAYAALAARQQALIVVSGRGRLPDAVAEVLRRAGVGEVRCGPHAAEDSAHAEPAGVGPALVVLCARHALDPRRGRGWRARGTPVLPVVVGSTEATVGPLGHHGAGPCLDCLDHTRTDLDPAWPALLSQLTVPRVGPGDEVDGEESLVAMTAAMAAMVALGLLDGHPLPGGRSLEVGLPWPGVRQREWSAHPRCGCGAGSAKGTAGTEPTVRNPAPDDALGRPAHAEGAASVRMAG